jgi:hypothetical protein
VTTILTGDGLLADNGLPGPIDESGENVVKKPSVLESVRNSILLGVQPEDPG